MACAYIGNNKNDRFSVGGKRPKSDRRISKAWTFGGSACYNGLMNGENIIFAPPVPQESAGIRLDRWLASRTELSRSRVSALIGEGAVLLNGVPVSAQDKKTAAGDVYEIRVPAPVSATPEPEDIPLDVVFEDDDLIVLNKAAGMVVHPAAGNYEGTLVNALLSKCAGTLSGIGGVARPGIVHRLDKDTSGLMVVAKNDFAHQALSEQFAVHSLERCYKALVWGTPQPLSGSIETQIGRSRFDRKKMAVVQNAGKRALTNYKVLEIFEGGAVSLVECSLKTGRTHQVRVHMAHIGHPLLGDALYGKTPKAAKQKMSAESFNVAARFPRQALHSYKMSFEHPRTHETMRFELPLPEDMRQTADALRNG